MKDTIKCKVCGREKVAFGPQYKFEKIGSAWFCEDHFEEGKKTINENSDDSILIEGVEDQILIYLKSSEHHLYVIKTILVLNVIFSIAAALILLLNMLLH